MAQGAARAPAVSRDRADRPDDPRGRTAEAPPAWRPCRLGRMSAPRAGRGHGRGPGDPPTNYGPVTCSLSEWPQSGHPRSLMLDSTRSAAGRQIPLCGVPSARGDACLGCRPHPDGANLPDRALASRRSGEAARREGRARVARLRPQRSAARARCDRRSRLSGARCARGTATRRPPHQGPAHRVERVRPARAALQGRARIRAPWPLATPVTLLRGRRTDLSGTTSSSRLRTLVRISLHCENGSRRGLLATWRG
jgi:hypothetical protein